MSVLTAGAVLARPRARRSALEAAGLLTAGGVLVAIGGLVGVAHSYDGSPLGLASGAVWTILLPALTALVVSGWRPTLGLAVCAGAGLVAVARIFSDLSLVTAPNAAIRPELFYEVSDRAQPFSAAGGVVFVLVGDVLTVLAGALAARRLSSSLSFAPDRIFDAAPDPSDDLGSGPGLLAQALESADVTRIGADSSSAQRADDAAAPQGPSPRSNWLVFVGFVGVLAVLAASLALPYQGGYLAARYLPPGLDLWGVGAALAGAAVATIAVLAAAVLPRQIALAVLGGVAIGALVPFLTAVAVRAVGAPVVLDPTVGVGVAGAVVIGAAGLLARSRLVQTDDDPSPSSVRTLNVVGAVLSLLVAGAASGAWRLPQLRYNGGADPRLASGYPISAPLSLPFLIAALVPFVGGLLWLVPPLQRSGRAVASVAWLATVVALTRSLDVLGAVGASASVPNGVFAPPTWSAGPGLWWGVAGVVLGVAALAVAVASGRRAADSSLLVAEEDSLDGSRSTGAVVAGVLTALTVIALALPVYRTTDGSSATLLVGFQVDSWGVLALAGGMVAAAWAGARAKWVTQAVAFPAAAAAILVVRLVIPASVRAQDGFHTGPGLVAGYVLVVAYLAGALVLGLSSRRIRMADPIATERMGTAAVTGKSSSASKSSATSKSSARRAGLSGQSGQSGGKSAVQRTGRPGAKTGPQPKGKPNSKKR